MARRKVGIPHSHGDALVPEKPLDGSDVHFCHYQPRSERMTQTMPREAANLRLADGRLEPMAWPSQRLALKVADHGSCVVASSLRSGARDRTRIARQI